MAPRPCNEASQKTSYGLDSSGGVRTGAEMSFSLSVESNIALRSPGILDMLLEEVGKRFSNLREILNKSLAIACKPKETAELLDILRRFPIHNCRYLLRINSNALGGDDVAKVKNFI